MCFLLLLARLFSGAGVSSRLPVRRRAFSLHFVVILLNKVLKTNSDNPAGAILRKNPDFSYVLRGDQPKNDL